MIQNSIDPGHRLESILGKRKKYGIDAKEKSGRGAWVTFFRGILCLTMMLLIMILACITFKHFFYARFSRRLKKSPGTLDFEDDNRLIDRNNNIDHFSFYQLMDLVRGLDVQGDKPEQDGLTVDMKQENVQAPPSSQHKLSMRANNKKRPNHVKHSSNRRLTRDKGSEVERQKKQF